MNELYLVVLLSLTAAETPPMLPAWYPEVVETAKQSADDIQKACDMPDSPMERFNVLEEVYIKAEEAKKVPSLALLNNNHALHAELTQKALDLPIQYYTLYSLLTEFQCAPEGVLIKKFLNV